MHGHFDEPAATLDRALSALLSGPDHALAAQVRVATVAYAQAVYGIVLEQTPGPPALADMHESLRSLLTGGVPQPVPCSRRAAPVALPAADTVVVPRPDPAAQLSALVAETVATHRRWLGSAEPGGSAAQLWEWLFLQSWRLPCDAREDVVRRVAALATEEPGLENGQLVPPSGSFGHPGRGATDVARTAFPGSGPAADLAMTLDELVTVAGSCAGLCTLFRSDVADPVPGNDDLAARYGTKVVDIARIGRDRQLLEVALVLYEGIGSLCPWPLPAPDSLWALRVRAAARLVESLNVHVGVRLFVLDENDDLPPSAPRDKVRVFSPVEQPEPRVWQLRIGMQVDGRVGDRGRALLLTAAERGG